MAIEGFDPVPCKEVGDEFFGQVGDEAVVDNPGPPIISPAGIIKREQCIEFLFIKQQAFLHGDLPPDVVGGGFFKVEDPSAWKNPLSLFHNSTLAVIAIFL